MRLGIDAAFAGTTEDFDAAYDAGIEWVGEYFGGAGCYHVWSNADRLALTNSKIPYRLPIWVPAQSFASDPRAEAEEALTSFRLIGFRQVIALDIEANSGYTLAWGEIFGEVLLNAGVRLVGYHSKDKQPPHMAASWLASWTGNPPGQLEPRSAVQYRGATVAYNMSVDFDIATDDFPLEGLNPLPTTVNEENMQAVINQKGELVIVGEALDNHNLLVFTEGPSGWSVTDVTDAIHNSGPQDPRTYQIS